MSRQENHHQVSFFFVSLHAVRANRSGLVRPMTATFAGILLGAATNLADARFNLGVLVFLFCGRLLAIRTANVTIAFCAEPAAFNLTIIPFQMRAIAISIERDSTGAFFL